MQDEYMSWVNGSSQVSAPTVTGTVRMSYDLGTS
jgi:hypothetical protein